MARGDEKLPADERVRRGVARTFLNVGSVLIALALLVVWAATGYYELAPGKAAVILRFGSLDRVQTEPGPKLHLPPPIEAHYVVDVAEIHRENFGAQGTGEAEDLAEAAIQTKDNNIVYMEFAVQYRVRDAFEARFRVAEPRELLRDAAQAAVREVVGRTSVDEVLSEGRGAVAAESRDLLQRFLDDYEAGIEVSQVQLREVQPPPQVSDAFDDVVAAAQDRDRQVQEARGYENEVLPRARAEAIELIAGAKGYEEAKVAEAKGEAARFLAVLEEYRKAPSVTRQRLYIEAMEEVLPDVEKILIEPGTSQVVPYLPLGRGREGVER